MARLIDADEALLRNDKMKNRSDVFRSYAKVVIDGTPTIDAVEVVRCKDCKHWDEETGFCDELSKFYNHGFDWYAFDADDFCSIGERKDNGC